MSGASKTGGCLCGAVRFTLNDTPTEYGACHCSMCRKFSGGIELGIQVMPGGIAWDADEDLATYTSSEWAERTFCGECGSALWYRVTGPGPMHNQTQMAAGLFENAAGASLKLELYIDKKPQGYEFAGKTHQMTEADVIAAFAPSEEGESQ